MVINVLLVEDHEIVRRGVRAMLESSEQICVVGEASNGREALDKLQQDLPDLVLMDMNMPEMGGIECTRRIKAAYPAVKVLTLSMHDDESYLIEMLEAGADGYILKNSTKEELLLAIQKTVINGSYVASEFTMGLWNRLKRENERKSKSLQSYDFSKRDLELIRLIAEGMTNQEIAEKTFSSVRTVETRRKKILEKIGLKNTASLIRFAVSSGIVN